MAIASSSDGTNLAAIWSMRIGTSEFSGNASGLHISTDSGETWKAVNTKITEQTEIAEFDYMEDDYRCIASSSDGKKIVMARTNGVLLFSTENDEVREWKFGKVPITTGILSSIASSGDGEKLVASVRGGAIWTSTDGGQMWSDFSLNETDMKVLELRLDALDKRYNEMITEMSLLSTHNEYLTDELADLKSHQSDTNYWSAWRVKPVDLS
jgi:photosystem II stability/assembly factor-like uncharacterized protein